VLAFSEFYAQPATDIIPDTTVSPGEAVAFPDPGPSDGSGAIYPSTASSYVLTAIGTYDVSFQVPVIEAGQLELAMNGAPLPYTVVGRSTGTTQITETTLVTTTSADSYLQVLNPLGALSDLIIAPFAGGTIAANATLVIERLR
jgi:hypothetical protein